MDVEKIQNAEQLAAWADKHGLRRDWHEPDEQNVDAYIPAYRANLDNAMGTALGKDSYAQTWEPCVVLTVDDEASAIINIADLLAWASVAHRAA